ncbi:MAG: hypothetical protein OEZ59_00635 [Deltaproteobacteria bacterium]|nr:hypothetical protein [Deltaproteobacteria bacterium]
MVGLGVFILGGLALAAVVASQSVPRGIPGPGAAVIGSPAKRPGAETDFKKPTRKIEEYEYVIFFDEELTHDQQISVFRNIPGVEYIEDGFYQGVVVVAIRPEGDQRNAIIRELKKHSEVITVLKATEDMICH